MAHDDDPALTPPPSGPVKLVRAFRGGAAIVTIGVASLGCGDDDVASPAVPPMDDGGMVAPMVPPPDDGGPMISPMVMIDDAGADASSALDAGGLDGGGEDGGGPPPPMPPPSDAGT
jgi:hypothetical protein